MNWNPLKPLSSNLQPRLKVSDYKKDVKIDFIKGDLVLDKYVEGFEAFCQKFTTVLLANETPIIKYGLFELLPISTTQNEFENQCEKLAQAIISHQFSDSTPEDPNGLGYTVEEIYGISKKSIDGINYILVELSASGTNEKIIIRVPLKFVE